MSRVYLPQLLMSLMFVVFIFLLGCSDSPFGDDSSSSRQSEKPYCSSSISYSSGITVFGKATYQARELTQNKDMLGHPGSARPIRYAEIQVLNSSQSVIQCAETDLNGNYSFEVEDKTQTIIIKVNSRGDNDYIKLSVLDKPSTKSPHFISATKTITQGSSTVHVATINAEATGSLEGGAFNIFDQILNANLFLIEETKDCESVPYSCPIFSPTKLIAYWLPGVNPGTYLGINGALTFYLPDDRSLYLLGGKEGDTDNFDTDHFDNSIIIHEYAHFLEHTYAGLDSPGGSHDGNSILDPRLAWSEGWANFFQSAVTGEPYYIDTFGNIDGNGAMLFFDENLESGTIDTPNSGNDGEGNFREFSISRTLWDLIDPHPISGMGSNESGDTAQIPFIALWNAFSSTTEGLNKSDTRFRNIGLFYEYLLDLNIDATEIIQTLQSELQAEDRRDYAAPIETSTTQCSLKTLIGELDQGYLEYSNQYASNDFYHYKHTGGRLKLELIYSQVSESKPTDLDLFLYKNEYVFGLSSDIISYSQKRFGETEMGEETIDLSSLFAGDYMINVRAYTRYGVGQGARYYLKLNGANLCPTQ